MGDPGKVHLDLNLPPPSPEPSSSKPSEHDPFQRSLLAAAAVDKSDIANGMVVKDASPDLEDKTGRIEDKATSRPDAGAKSGASRKTEPDAVRKPEMKKRGKQTGKMVIKDDNPDTEDMTSRIEDVTSGAEPDASPVEAATSGAPKKTAPVGKKKEEEKNVKLGKKRGRQTVLLELGESLQIARPPKVPATQRSTVAPQSSSSRQTRESIDMREQTIVMDESDSRRSCHSRDDDFDAKESIPKTRDMEARQLKPQFQRPTLRRQPEIPNCNGMEEKPQSQQQYPQRPPGKRQAGPKRQGSGHYPPDSSIERLHREATCDKLWQQSTGRGETELQRVPGSFASLEDYLQVFEPLLFEECRAQLHNSWEELCDLPGKDIHVPVSIRSVEKRDRGWYDVTAIPVDSRHRLNFKEGDVAVLSTPHPAGRRKGRGKEGTVEEVKEEGEISVQVAGIVRRFVPVDVRDTHGAFLFVNISDVNSDTRGGGYPGQVLNDLQHQGVIWFLTVLGTLATTQREYVALHALHRLHPQMVNAILQPRPELFPRYDQEQPVSLGCFTPAFVEHLHNNFNLPQLSSIQWAAMHTAAGTNSAAGSGKKQELWPFTLVQGPPGTGKTHTVWGMLNVIHLVQYQRYYTALLKKIAPGSLASDEGSASMDDDEQGGWIDEVLQKMDRSLSRMLPRLCPKPRMLVCAPSNAATDELLARVLDKGFIDGEMKVYRPDVARVGTDPQSRAAQAVSVERRTDQLLAKGREEVVAWLQQMRVREMGLAQSIAGLQKDLNSTAAARSQGTVGVDPEVLTARDQARDMKLQHLAALLEERDKLLVEMSRLYIVENLSRPSGGFTLEEARQRLEASFANEAEIVFTTVSSSGRKLFTNLARGFDIVVIDEAAQASEVGVLPPLILGAARCVLVGDPQQLPATVISRVADTMQFSRSLFERFQQAGCPTLMLTVQYRMHPQIRDFPSRYFYQGRLQDSDSIKSLPDEVYHQDPLLQPYHFFDVSHGRESHITGSVSYQNVLEAKFAARLYEHLQSVLKAQGKQKVTVGVISPYKLQLKCLHKEFESVVTADADVYINTVDAFQGQERDVIIMSCVRASSHGVGFVADIRRMNVALTRARRSLWVVGNASTLLQSEDWGALITDAKARGCFISYSAAVEKGLIVDGLLSDTQPREPVLSAYNSRPADFSKDAPAQSGGSQLRAGIRERTELRGGRLGGLGRHSFGRGRHDSSETERKKTSDSYLRQHNSLRRG